MYFDKFQKVQYLGKTAVDITQAVLVKYRRKNDSNLWRFHTVVDGETPLTVSEKYYGTTENHWIILLINNIVDPFYDWVLSPNKLKAMLYSKYGEDGVDKVHHLVDITTKKIIDPATTALYVTDGVVTSSLPFNYTIVTNNDYETEKNDEKRDIKILNPRYVQDFKNQFEDAVKGL